MVKSGCRERRVRVTVQTQLVKKGAPSKEKGQKWQRTVGKKEAKEWFRKDETRKKKKKQKKHAALHTLLTLLAVCEV